MEFQDKAVIITGSSRGIGRAAALAFAKQGASVTIHGQNAQKLNETKELLRQAGTKESQIVSVLGPIEEEKTAKELVEKTVAAFGKIDVLVNNAGIRQKPGEIDTHSMANFDYVFAVNLRSVVQLTSLATPYLAKTKGNVVNVSSVASMFATMHSMFYGMTKAALNHYTRDMANVLGQKHGIRVNTINPGPIESEFLTRWGTPEEQVKSMKDEFSKRVIAKRFGSCEELVDVLVFLASKKASYIWGATIVVDGGMIPFATY